MKYLINSSPSGISKTKVPTIGAQNGAHEGFNGCPQQAPTTSGAQQVPTAVVNNRCPQPSIMGAHNGGGHDGWPLATMGSHGVLSQMGTTIKKQRTCKNN